MQKPASIRQVELLLYASILIWALVQVVQHRMGITSSNEFFGQILYAGVLCMFPFKIAKGSNATRYVFVIGSVISILLVLGGLMPSVRRLELIYTWLDIPFSAYVSWLLFQSDANEWFGSGGKQVRRDVEPHWSRREE
jgi:hypothetical protein